MRCQRLRTDATVRPGSCSTILDHFEPIASCIERMVWSSSGDHAFMVSCAPPGLYFSFCGGAASPSAAAAGIASKRPEAEGPGGGASASLCFALNSASAFVAPGSRFSSGSHVSSSSP